MARRMWEKALRSQLDDENARECGVTSDDIERYRGDTAKAVREVTARRAVETLQDNKKRLGEAKFKNDIAWVEAEMAKGPQKPPENRFEKMVLASLKRTRRPGAGRPKKPGGAKQTIAFRLSPEKLRIVDERRKGTGLSRGAWFESLI